MEVDNRISEIVVNRSIKERESFPKISSSANEFPESRSDKVQAQLIDDKREGEANPDHDHLTSLYSLVKAKNWDLVIQRCSGPDRKEAGFWVVQNQKDGDFEWKSLPIHLVSL